MNTIEDPLERALRELPIVPGLDDWPEGRRLLQPWLG